MAIAGNDLLGDPLVQLNLVLNLAIAPEIGNTRTKPIFREQGYEIYAISQALPIPRNILASLTRNFPDHMKRSITPEVILVRTDRPTYMLIECKRSSFPQDDNESVGQARGYLSLTGERLADLFGHEGLVEPTAAVAYLTRESERARLGARVTKLIDEMSEAGIQVTEDVTIMGIQRRGDRLFLDWTCLTPPPTGLSGETPVEIVRLESPEDEYHPFYLIPIDLGVNSNANTVARRSFEERFRVTAMGMLLKAIHSSPSSFSIDDCMKPVLLLWDQWRDKGSKREVKSWARSQIERLLHALSDRLETDSWWSYAKGQYSFQSLPDRDKQRATGFLLSKRGRQQDLGFEQIQLPIDDAEV